MTWHAVGFSTPLQKAMQFCWGNLTEGGGFGDGIHGDGRGCEGTNTGGDSDGGGDDVDYGDGGGYGDGRGDGSGTSP